MSSFALLLIVQTFAWLDSSDFSDPSTDLDEKIIEQMIDSFPQVPGLCAVLIEESQMKWEGYYGWANYEQQVPVTQDTLFEVASISKTIMVAVVMQQVEQGLDLDGDINDVLPFSVRNPLFPDDPITLRQLLTHYSSLLENSDIIEANWYTNQDYPLDLNQTMYQYFVPSQQFYDLENFGQYAPGEEYSYTDMGTSLAALVAEAYAGISFDQLALQGVIEPLGLTGASFRLAGMDQSQIAMPYDQDEDGTLVQMGHHGYMGYPAGLFRAKCTQIATFLLAFMNDGQHDGVRILEEASVEEIKRIQYPDIDESQGLIFYYAGDGDDQTIGHDGGDPGVSSSMHYRLSDNKGYVVISNSSNDLDLESDIIGAVESSDDFGRNLSIFMAIFIALQMG